MQPWHSLEVGACKSASEQPCTAAHLISYCCFIVRPWNGWSSPLQWVNALCERLPVGIEVSHVRVSGERHGNLEGWVVALYCLGAS
jgi:hypothetical protein